MMTTMTRWYLWRRRHCARHYRRRNELRHHAGHASAAKCRDVGSSHISAVVVGASAERSGATVPTGTVAPEGAQVAAIPLGCQDTSGVLWPASAGRSVS